MSGEGHLPALETMIDDAMRRRRAAIACGQDRSEAHWTGQVRGIARVIALIAGTDDDYEFNEATRRVG